MGQLGENEAGSLMRVWSRSQPRLGPAQTEVEAGGFASELTLLVSAGSCVPGHVAAEGVVAGFLQSHSSHLLVVLSTTPMVLSTTPMPHGTVPGTVTRT